MRTLPIRAWLALALVTLVAIPLLTMVAIGVAVSRQSDAPKPIAEIVQAGAARWHDPAWLDAVKKAAAGRGIDLILVDADGAQLLRTLADPMAPKGTPAHNDGLVTSRDEALYRVKLPSGGTGLAYIYGVPYPARRTRRRASGVSRSPS